LKKHHKFGILGFFSAMASEAHHLLKEVLHISIAV